MLSGHLLARSEPEPAANFPLPRTPLTTSALRLLPGSELRAHHSQYSTLTEASASHARESTRCQIHPAKRTPLTASALRPPPRFKPPALHSRSSNLTEPSESPPLSRSQSHARSSAFHSSKSPIHSEYAPSVSSKSHPTVHPVKHHRLARFYCRTHIASLIISPILLVMLVWHLTLLHLKDSPSFMDSDWPQIWQDKWMDKFFSGRRIGLWTLLFGTVRLASCISIHPFPLYTATRIGARA
ncbi:hypothetical protein BCR34DRAFT_30790 [Clohesyomyces aquaticus]|uniref:Uncharacterized protein n=1 Tax=Clohesyomyces aquaticus TaxID=1231657 RepID=A0A1Y1Z9D3_9PLEO|nr:hypothetical protein BCR34DRAFT_30790 [Clohesyomyces aquaticus]